jgi:UPF0716 protein FxsA
MITLMQTCSLQRNQTLFPFSLTLLALPLIEIAAFVLVGSRIGVLPTIGLVILSGIAGGILLRIQGFGILTKIRQQVEAGRDPGRELAHGVMILLAGILLLIPGFVTDILGILLFIPPIRDFGWYLVRDRITVSGGLGGGRWPNNRSGRKTIDLNEDEYSKEPDKRSPWRRLDKDDL